MKIFGQLTLLATLGLVSSALASVLPFPFPGSIMSMLLLLGLMIFRIIKEEHIGQVAQFFLRYMGAFFVVPTIAIIEHKNLLQGFLIPFILVCIIATLLTFMATTLAVKITIRLLHKKEQQ